MELPAGLSRDEYEFGLALVCKALAGPPPAEQPNFNKDYRALAKYVESLQDKLSYGQFYEIIRASTCQPKVAREGSNRPLRWNDKNTSIQENELRLPQEAGQTGKNKEEDIPQKANSKLEAPEENAEKDTPLLPEQAPEVNAENYIPLPPKKAKDLSRQLARLLRHRAKEHNLPLGSDGYARLAEVLALPMFKGVTVREVEDVVERCEKKRFKMERRGDEMLIRANQGHSSDIQVNEEELCEAVLRAEEVPCCVHGTYLAAWEAIKKRGGLSRMARKHIHFAPAPPGEQVRSGMRKDCEVAVFVSVCSAMADGLRFFRSANGVILTPGDANGLLPFKHIEKVIRLADGAVLWPEPAEEEAEENSLSPSTGMEETVLEKQRKESRAATTGYVSQADTNSKSTGYLLQQMQPSVFPVMPVTQGCSSCFQPVPPSPFYFQASTPSFASTALWPVPGAAIQQQCLYWGVVTPSLSAVPFASSGGYPQVMTPSWPMMASPSSFGGHPQEHWIQSRPLGLVTEATVTSCPPLVSSTQVPLEEPPGADEDEMPSPPQEDCQDLPQDLQDRLWKEQVLALERCGVVLRNGFWHEDAAKPVLARAKSA